MGGVIWFACHVTIKGRRWCSREDSDHVIRNIRSSALVNLGKWNHAPDVSNSYCTARAFRNNHGGHMRRTLFQPLPVRISETLHFIWWVYVQCQHFDGERCKLYLMLMLMTHIMLAYRATPIYSNGLDPSISRHWEVVSQKTFFHP